MHRLLVMVGIVMILTGCAQETDPKSRFLRGDPCKPPCFEGIEPGVTTLAEAETKLVSSSHIGDEGAAIRQVGEHPLLEWSYGDSVHWVGRANSGLEGSEDSTVTAISVAAPDLCLSEVSAVYGDPDVLFLPGYQAAGWIAVIWEEMGMLYSSNADDEPGGKIEIAPCGGAVEFIVPGEAIQTFPSFVLYSNINDGDLNALMVEWQGIDHDYGEGDFEMPITP